MADWSVNIRMAKGSTTKAATKKGSTGKGGAVQGDTEIVVDLPGYTQGQALDAAPGDVVSWYNQTDDKHQLLMTVKSSNPPFTSNTLNDAIPPGQSSDAYVCAPPKTSPAPDDWVVTYQCKLHPQNLKESGTINVTTPPSS